ncbi:beta strand repeat-containing protein [Herbaspirillum rhizosphaerae]|uniref:beta strand repeat-containing protein n=1 Tax=Herbaspirillum rhizosphaerae TaxID=346179 RepID=UPI001969F8D7|nr:hypothetical protein [Herbaspirillum rhizosphaerae]
MVSVPNVGTGGEWFIDPYDLTVVASGSSSTSTSGNVITSTGSSATIEAGTIATQLNMGNSVTLATGAGGSASGGNITVNAAINKTGGSSASLTLNANNSIAINADITSTSGALNLNLNSNLSGIAGDHTANVSGALVRLNGGILNVSDGSGNSGNGNLAIKSGATIDLNQSGMLNAGTVTIDSGGALTSVYNAGVSLAGDLNNSGTVGLNNSALSVGGKLTNQGTVNLANVSGSLGNVTNSGVLTMASMFQGITATAFNNTGSLGLSNGSTLNAGALTNSGTATINASTLNVSTLTNTATGTATFIDGSVSATDKITNAGQFTVTNGTINTVNGFTNVLNAVLNLNYLSNIHTGGFNNAGMVTANGSAGYVTFENGFTNSGQMNFSNNIMSNGSVSNTGTIGVTDAYFRINNSVDNSGSFNITNSRVEASSGFTNNAQGTLNVNYNTTFLTGAVTNLGTMSLDSTANKPNGYTGVTAIGFNNGVTNFGNMTVIGDVTSGGSVTNGNSDHLTGNISLSAGATFSGGDWQNTGNLSLASGAAITGGDLSNNGRVVLTGASLGFNTITNNDGASLSGTGSITASGQFTNNGVLSPGGIGTVGTLGITGNFTQGVTGVLNLDVAGDTSYDLLTTNGLMVQLGGTLQTKLLGGYVPTLNTRFTPITFAGSNAGSSYFSHVLGDIVNTGSGLQMIKVDYKGSLALAMTGSEDLTFSGGEGGGWNNLTSWSTGNLPTAIDNVFINNGVVTHNVGGSTDVVNNLTISNGAQLNVTAGGLQTTNLTAPTSSVAIGTPEGPGGSLTITGTAQIGSLSVMYGGYSLNGTSSSTINVNGAFSQDYSGVINSSGNVSLTQTDGNLTVGNITAANLTLASTTGAITQNDVLHVKRQLSSSSVSGTTLDNSNNQIAAYAGANSASGDIVLVNRLNVTDTSAVRLNDLSNAGGNISVDNTGGMVLAGNANASGSVSLVTHSPLTTNGNITAGNGITLAAGVPGSGLANDSIVVNGQLTSTGGIISLLAGGSLTVNGNIVGVFPPPPAPNPPPVFGPGVTLNGVLVGPPLPVSSSTPTVTVATDTTSQIDRSVNNTQTSSTSTTTTTTSTNPVLDTTQTTGGGADSFGGDDSGTANGQSKPADSGKKVVKLYCS